LSTYSPASDKASDVYSPARSTPALTTPGVVYSPPSPGYSPRTPPESEDDDDD
jgi:hypothetical protein